MQKPILDFFQNLSSELYTPAPNEVKSLFFSLAFDDENNLRIYIKDKSGNETYDFDYRYYNEPERNFLKNVQNIISNWENGISWDNTKNGIPAKGNENLLKLLSECTNVFNSNNERLRFFNNRKEKVCLEILGEETLETKLNFQGASIPSKDFQFLTDSYIMIKNKIYEIEPLNGDIKYIRSFLTQFSKSDLNIFLSILLSIFPGLKIKYRDYEIIYGSPITPSPSLIIDKIDQYKSLFIRISLYLQGFPAELLQRYQISNAVTVDEEEQKIIINNIIYTNIYNFSSRFRKTLNKFHKKIENVEKNSFYNEGSMFVIEENLAKYFLEAELPNIIKEYTILGADKIKEYKIVSSKPKLNISLKSSIKSGIDYLEPDAKLTIEDEEIPIFDAIHQFENNKYIKLNDGKKAIIDNEYINKLKRIFKKKDGKIKLSFFDLPIVEEIIEEKISDPSFIKSKEIFKGFNKLKSEPPLKLDKINVSLRPYQKDGCKWLNYLHKTSLGGCLADDMGLGKTLQTVAMLSTIYPKVKTPSLIVMPKSLLFNWKDEIEKFAPHLKYYRYYETKPNQEELNNYQIILTTYGKLRNDIEVLRKVQFYYVILDESQNIKNIDAKVTKAAMLLKSKHRLALSGTPIENNLSELYSLFRFLNPSMFGSLQEFNKNYANPIQKENDRNVSHELRKKIYPFILRRLKKEVLKELPEKIEQTIYVEMTKQQKQLYEQRRKTYREMINNQVKTNGIKKSRFVIFQALSELRQLASVPESKSKGRIVSPKREVLCEKIYDAVTNGHKVIVFANFLDGVNNISEDLDKIGIDNLIMTGATKNRERTVSLFQENENNKVIIVTLKTGSLGLNLTAADTVFITDPWWNEAAESQAIDRTHRIGQDKTVFCYKMITNGSIEEKIRQLQEKKKELFDNIISSDSESIKSLTEEDLDFILGT